MVSEYLVVSEDLAARHCRRMPKISFPAGVCLYFATFLVTTGGGVHPIAPAPPLAPGKSLPATGVPNCACQVPWVDKKLSELEKEMAEAAARGITPVRISGPASILSLGGEGTVFKWVLSQQGELIGLPTLKDDVIKHSVATGGKPVCAAGMGLFVHGLLLIDRKSGHYKPDQASLKLAARKFQSVGFEVQTVGLIEEPAWEQR